MSLVQRLKNERLRLGMTQKQAATAGGVTKRCQVNYENGRRVPKADYLFLLGRHGFDAAYITTGLAQGEEPEHNDFAEPLQRLKKELGCTEDQEVAAWLGMSKAAFSARKARQSFPVERLCAVGANSPEADIDVNYVLTGSRSTSRPETRLAQVIEGEWSSVSAFARAIDENPQRVRDVMRGKQRIPQDMLTAMHHVGIDIVWVLTGETKSVAAPRQCDEAMAAMYHRMHQLVLRAVAEEFATTPLEVLRASIRLPSEENEGAQP